MSLNKSQYPFFKQPHVAALALFLISLALVTLEWTIFRISVLPDHPSPIVTFLKGLADMLLILSPFFFVKPKHRWLVLLPVCLLSLFFLANMLYFRVFGQLIPLESLMFWKNFDNTLWHSVGALFQGVDIVYMLSPVVVGVYIVAVKRASAPPFFSKKSGLWFLVVGLLYYVATYAFIFNREQRQQRINGIDITASELFKDTYCELVATSHNIRHDTGLLHYLVMEVVREIATEPRIDQYSDAQHAEIDSLLQLRREQYVPADSIFLHNRSKNLILIIVESLNSECVGKEIDGVELTPTLNRLLFSEGTVAALNVVSQVGDGRSSDGQMLYNIGLLPRRRGAAAMSSGSNQYVAFPEILGKRYAVEMICESRFFWNHAVTSTQYGYDRLYDQESLLNVEEKGFDEALFCFAASELQKLPRPFVAQLTTLSMHLPFSHVGSFANDTLLRASEIPALQAAYFNSVRYFDECLGRFLDQLAKTSLAAESVIVIVADHSEIIASSTPDDPSASLLIPFIALNTGKTLKVDKVVGQCDIFPTMLDIMGVTDPDIWRGVGLSIFNPLAEGALARDGTVCAATEVADMRRAWDVSDLLLRGHGTKQFAAHPQ